MVALYRSLALGTALALVASAASAQQEPVELQPVVVEGNGGKKGQPPATGTVGQPPAPYKGGQVGTGSRLGVLGNKTFLTTPFSSTGYTEKLIRDQQSSTVADVVLNDPSVRNDAPPFSERDSFMIRGFSVTNLDVLYDGLPYLVQPRRSFLEGIERVEILKGPSAFLNGGLGRVGGTINLIPKRATDEPITRLTTGYQSDTQFNSHVDFARRFGPEGEWGVRANGSFRKGDTTFDNNEVEVGVGALGLDFRGERVRASLDLNHTTQNLDAPTSLFNGAVGGITIPGAPDGRVNTANSFEYHDSTHNMASGRVEFDVLENTTLYAAGGLSRYREDFLTTSFTIGSAIPGQPNSDLRPGAARADFGFQPQQIQGFSGEAGVRSEFDTGPIGHQLNISVSQALNENYRGGFAPGALGLPGPYYTNIYDPTFYSGAPIDIDRLPTSDDLPLFADLLATSVAVSDTLSFYDDRFQLTLGGRYQDMRSRSFNTRPDRGPVGVRNYLYEDARFSPAVAGLARITDNLSVYANYVEALTEGLTAPGAAINAGEMFAPTVNKQVEVGVKYDFGSVGIGGAYFEIEQPSGYTDPDTRVFSVDGLQVNRGLELSVFGEPVDGIRLLGGVTFMDAELAKTQTPANDGNDVPGVPKVAINLYGEYDAPWLVEGLTLTGRVIYNGSAYYDPANTQKVSDWTRVDAGLRYTFERENGKPIVLKANVLNVFDEAYWASSARGFLAAGAPRTFTLSATFDF